MISHDFISPEGLRLDGRRAHEIRTLRCKVGDVTVQADGSAYIEMGQTKVIASVQGPKEARRRDQCNDVGIVTCDFTIAPFSSMNYRKARKNDRQSTEMALRIKQTFEAAIILDRYPRSEIAISVLVMEADGGICSAAINAVTLALLDAGVCMRDMVVSCTCGYLEDVLIDLSHVEMGGCLANLTLGIRGRTKKAVLMEMESKISVEAFDKLYDACIRGCDEVHNCLQAAMRDAAVEILSRSNKSLSQMSVA
eukprot:Selendium_serpulae@DN5199_c0_g1_i3.p1